MNAEQAEANGLKEGETLEWRSCKKCGILTLHVIHDSGHERDSSNDWVKCTACGETSFGVF